MGFQSVREAFKKNKEFQLGNCPKRWEGVNLKTLFFIVENKEIQVRREGVRAKFPYFCPNFKWCPLMFFKQTFP